MAGIKDYTYQNIIFVHDFVFIFLILVFWMIIAYFIIIFFEYTPKRLIKYWKVIYKMKKMPFHLQLLRKKKFRLLTKNQKDWNYWSRYYGKKVYRGVLPIVKKYGKEMKYILNQSHNLTLEVIWTFIPIIIILELIFPSLSLIADDEISNKASLHTVNVIGNQWYWSYELNVVMSTIKQVSNLVLLDESERSHKRYSRLLATTNAVSIPVGLKTSFFISSNDVAHSWAIPGMGIKVDAIPGRINLKTVIASKIGLFSGMCSELCGIEHGFMPISLKVLTLNKWGYNLEYFSEKTLNYNDIRDIWYI